MSMYLSYYKIFIQCIFCGRGYDDVIISMLIKLPEYLWCRVFRFFFFKASKQNITIDRGKRFVHIFGSMYMNLIFKFSVERTDITCESSFANTEVTPDPKSGVCCLCRNGKSQQKFAMACAIVLCLAITWVASAQLCRETYIPGQFLSPLLCLYFWSSWLIFFYPIYVGIELLVSKGDFPVGQTFRFVVVSF